MKSVLFYLGLTVMVFSVTFVSCKKEDNDNSCNVSNPTEDLVWLKEVIEASENEIRLHKASNLQKKYCFLLGKL